MLPQVDLPPKLRNPKQSKHLGMRRMRVDRWGQLPACRLGHIRKLEAYATLREQNLPVVELAKSSRAANESKVRKSGSLVTSATVGMHSPASRLKGRRKGFRP